MKNLGLKTAAMIAGLAALGACGGDTSLGNGMLIKHNVAMDGGLNSHPLSEMRAGIWVDGLGCEHWIIDDGLEGYLSTRFAPNGKPYCNANNRPYTSKGFVRSRWGSESTANQSRFTGW